MAKKTGITVRLDDEARNKLDAIRKHYGINKETDAIRLCINDAYRIVLERDKIFKALGESK